jgi:hypothetical protein
MPTIALRTRAEQYRSPWQQPAPVWTAALFPLPSGMRGENFLTGLPRLVGHSPQLLCDPGIDQRGLGSHDLVIVV